jgi:hypothetical protein
VHLGHERLPGPLAGDGPLHRKLGQVQVKSDKVYRIVQTHRIDPHGVVAQDMVLDHFGGQGLLDRRVA